MKLTELEIHIGNGEEKGGRDREIDNERERE